MGRGGDRQAFDDQLGVFVELLALVPGGAGIELYPEGRGQHGGSEVFGIIAALVSCHAAAVMLGDIAVHIGIGRPRQTDAGVNAAARLVGLRAGEDRERNLTRPQCCDAGLSLD